MAFSGNSRSVRNPRGLPRQRVLAVLLATALLAFVRLEVASADTPHSLPIALEAQTAGEPTRATFSPDAFSASQFTITVDGETFTAARTFEMTAGDHTVIRFAIGEQVSTVTKNGSDVVAELNLPSGVFTLARRGPDYRVARADTALALCGTSAFRSPLGHRALLAAPSGHHRIVAHPAPVPVQVDAAVIYTPEALAAAGDLNHLRTLVLAAHDQLNTYLATSGVGNISFRVVAVLPAGYPDAGDSNAALDWMSGYGTPAEPQLIRDLRSSYGADVVELWSKTIGPPRAFRPVEIFHESEGFAVTEALSGNARTLAHELGHVLGCDHDLTNTTLPLSEDPNPFAHGFRHPTTPRFMCIMSYGLNGCESCPFYLGYSNPGVTYLGVQTGSETYEDCARMIRIGAPLVAAYATK